MDPPRSVSDRGNDSVDPPRVALVGKAPSRVSGKTGPWVKKKKSKATPPQLTEEFVISETHRGMSKWRRPPPVGTREVGQRSLRTAPPKDCHLSCPILPGGSVDISGFLPTRAQRDEEEDERLAFP